MTNFFTPSEVEDTEDFAPIPDGTYRLLVLDSEYKATKAGTGHYMAVAFQVVGGKCDNRRLFSNFNLENPSEVATKIGRSEMKKFLAALGFTAPLKDENEFHRLVQGKTVAADVEIEVGKDGVKRNRVKRFILNAELPKTQKSSGPMTDAELPF